MRIDAVNSYLSLRRAAGFELGTPGYLLRSLARYACNAGEDLVRSGTVIEWAGQALSISQRDRRLNVVRRLARHMQAEDRRPRRVYLVIESGGSRPSSTLANRSSS